MHRSTSERAASVAEEPPRPRATLAMVDLEALEVTPPSESCRSPVLESGTVRATAGALLVELASGTRVARRAKSCLVAPDEGDRVLCALDRDELFVLAVLEGAKGAATRVVADGDLQVQATGTLGLGAAERVDVVAHKGLGLFSQRIELRAKAAAAAIDELGLVGRSLEAHVEQAIVVAEQLESRATRIVQRAKQVFRFVEGLDQLRAAVFDVRASSLAAVRGDNTIVAARVLAKLDGEQVKIG